MTPERPGNCDLRSDPLLGQDGLRQADLSKIAVVGELTTDEGPFADDHYLVLVTQSGDILEVSMDTSAATDLLEHLRIRLGPELHLGLANQTSFMSRILWPPSLKGEALFAFRRIRQPGVWGRIRELAHFSPVRREISSGILRFLEERNVKPAQP